MHAGGESGGFAVAWRSVATRVGGRGIASEFPPAYARRIYHKRRAHGPGPVTVSSGLPRYLLLVGITLTVAVGMGGAYLVGTLGLSQSSAQETGGTIPMVPGGSPAKTSGAEVHSGMASPSASPQASASPTPRRHASSSPATKTAQMTARYGKAHTHDDGYTLFVALGNEGQAPAASWTLVITLGGSNPSVSFTTGVTYTRNGATLTLRPDSSNTNWAPGHEGGILIGVDSPGGYRPPAACTIDGRPCQG